MQSLTDKFHKKWSFFGLWNIYGKDPPVNQMCADDVSDPTS